MAPTVHGMPSVPHHVQHALQSPVATSHTPNLSSMQQDPSTPSTASQFMGRGSEPSTPNTAQPPPPPELTTAPNKHLKLSTSSSQSTENLAKSLTSVSGANRVTSYARVCL